VIEAARYLGVAPWELVAHLEWLPFALAARQLVHEAEEHALKRARRTHADRR